jgi:hypothetical protein
MTFPNGLQPDAKNDTDVSLWQKAVQSAAAWATSLGKSNVQPNPQDSIEQSMFKMVQNLYYIAN